MSNQNRQIMGCLNYSLATLQEIKTTLSDVSHPHKEMNWAVGGIISTLSTQLLRICNDTFVQTGNSGEANAQDDLREIQAKFNDFMDRMINHE